MEIKYEKMNLCIIPARSGSKRIPNKNIMPFMGKPIIAYVIEKAISSGLFDEVMVSTDSEIISDIAIFNKASVPFLRSDFASNDFASTADVILEVINSYKMQGKIFENICCIYPTSVLVSINQLVSGFKMLSDFDSIITVQKFRHPIQRAISINTSNQATWKNADFEFFRTQDFESSYFDSGQFYWLKADSFVEEKKIIGKKCGSIVLSEMESHDIDVLEDVVVAEIKYNLQKKNRSI